MIILIVLILGILQILLNLIFKPNYNTLNCGIWGQASNSTKKINESNIKILGLFNESRGKNSCGITIDGEIYYGLDKEALFTNFAKGRSIKPTLYPTVIGHTRQSSIGVINSYNAHPFGFGENKDGGYKMCIVHNGTLLNHKELADKYEVSKDIDSPSLHVENFNVVRTKIDSEILGEIIYKTGNIKVLSDYNGAAALVWTDTDHPNVIYLWSGKSRAWSDDAEDKQVEERPMFVYIESKNNFYFSSLAEPLHVIRNNNGEIFQIDYNTVYTVKDGNFKEAKKLLVSRKDNYQREIVKYTSYTGGYNYGDDWEDSRWLQKPKTSGQTVINLPAAKEEVINIFDDTTLKTQNEYKGKVVNKKLRYYRNNHLINGVYTNIINFDFFYLGDIIKEAKAHFGTLVNKPFNYSTGEFGDIEDKDLFETPFKHDAPTLFYFVEGIMLRTELDYLTALAPFNIFKNGDKWDYEKLSHASMLPVVDLTSKPSDSKQMILKHGVEYNGIVTGLNFEKRYEISKGNLIKILPLTAVNTNSVVKLANNVHRPIILKECINFITNLEENIEIEEVEEGTIKQLEQDDKEFLDSLNDNIDNIDYVADAVDGILNDCLTGPLIKFQDYKVKLSYYLPHVEAVKALKVLEDMENVVGEFIKN